MSKILACLIAPIFLSLSVSSTVFASDDMPGAADHPELPRIAGSSIIAYYQSEYGDHDFLVNYNKEDKKTELSSKEGKITRLVYALEKQQTPLFALRNYQEAFAELGEVKELYTCRKKECPENIGRSFIWGKEKRIESNVKVLNAMNAQNKYNIDSIYSSAEVQSETANYTVSIYSAKINGAVTKTYLKGFEIGQAVVHIDIVESASFKSDLKVVEASEIQSAIADQGHITLQGLFFDTGSDQLTKESEPALSEISKALNADQSLNVYVVGHTDSVGSVESNQQLSERRAKSIVKSLTTQFEIEGARLIPIGVGLAAPVATNRTEEGRSLNRRVELVERVSN